MTLIVEDGSGSNPLANTYITDADFVAYADSIGATYPATPTEREPLIIAAKNYTEGFRARYIGAKNAQAQPLQWPRYGAYVDGYEIANDEIPVELKNAQAQAAIERNSSALYSNTKAGIKRKKVDVLETEYENGGSAAQKEFTAVMAWLDPLLKSNQFLVNPVR